jgi:hypothetical protein
LNAELSAQSAQGQVMADTILQTLEDAYNQLTLVLSALTSGTNPQITLLANGVTAKGGTNDKLDCSNEMLAKVHTALHGPNSVYERLGEVQTLVSEGNKHTEHLANGVTAKDGTNEKLDCSNEGLAKVYMALHGPNSLYERLGEMKTLISEGNKYADQYLRTVDRIETSLNKAHTTLSSVLNVILAQTCDAQNKLASSLKQLYDEIHQMHVRLIPIEVVVRHLEGMRESVASIAQERRNQAESRSVRPHHQKKD